jgi:hypothetical protein
VRLVLLQELLPLVQLLELVQGLELVLVQVQGLQLLEQEQLTLKSLLLGSSS